MTKKLDHSEIRAAAKAALKALLAEATREHPDVSQEMVRRRLLEQYPDLDGARLDRCISQVWTVIKTVVFSFLAKLYVKVIYRYPIHGVHTRSATWSSTLGWRDQYQLSATNCTRRCGYSRTG